MSKLLLASMGGAAITYLPRLSKINPSATKVAFIANASDLYPDPWWLKEDIDNVKSQKYLIQNLDLKTSTKSNIESIIKKSQIIFVAGGNTFYLQKIMKRSGFFEILPKILRQYPNKIYVGSSAGTMSACPDITCGGGEDELKQVGTMDNYNGLNLVNFVVLPHWGHKKYQEEYKSFFSKIYQSKYSSVTLTNDQFVWVESDTFKIFNIFNDKFQITKK
jgi:dipeptidase E